MTMEQSEKIFWGLAAVSAIYIVVSGSYSLGMKANAQVSQQAVQQAAPMNGMGCMAKGGGCGCGGMMKK